MWDIPGLYNNPTIARRMAKEAGIEIPDTASAPEGDGHTHAVETPNGTLETGPADPPDGVHTHTLEFGGETLVSGPGINVKGSEKGKHYHEFVLASGDTLRTNSVEPTPAPSPQASEPPPEGDNTSDTFGIRSKIADERTPGLAHTPTSMMLARSAWGEEKQTHQD